MEADVCHCNNYRLFPLVIGNQFFKIQKKHMKTQLRDYYNEEINQIYIKLMHLRKLDTQRQLHVEMNNPIMLHDNY